jgi:hypothetical protein
VPLLTRRNFLRYAAGTAGATLVAQGLRLPSAEALVQPACRWGAFVEPADPIDPLDPLATTKAFENEIGRRLGMTRHYLRWDYRPIPSLAMQQSANGHRVPFMDWRPQLLKESGNGFIRWGDIAKGLHDSEIDEVGTALASWNKPVYFTFNHEPENDAVNCGTAQQYRNAYARIRNRFVALGASKIKYVCTLVQGTFKGLHGGPDAWFFSGAQFVGADGYNRSNCSGGWKTFETLFSGAHNFAVARGKKMVIEEWGCVENAGECADPSTLETKADWFSNSAATIKSWPEIKAVIYTNVVATYRTHTVDFRILTSDAAQAAYIEVGHDPYFNSG